MRRLTDGGLALCLSLTLCAGGALAGDPLADAIAVWDFAGESGDGAARRFDGVEDHVMLGQGAAGELGVTGALSVFARVRPDAWPHPMTILSKRGRSVADRSYQLDLEGPVLSFRINAQDSSTVQATLDALPTDWTDVAAVFVPGERTTLYVDGAKVAENVAGIPDAITASETPAVIGAQPYKGLSNFFKGAMERIALWARPLSAAEVASLSDDARLAPTPAPGPEPADTAEAPAVLDPIDRLFAADLYPPVTPVGAGRSAWHITADRVARATVTGEAHADGSVLLNGRPTLRLTTPERHGKKAVVRATWTEGAVPGSLYRFSAALKSTPKRPEDSPSSTGLRGRLELTWLDEAGKRVPVRDNLVSRVTSEPFWSMTDVTALCPARARKASLSAAAFCYEARLGLAAWFGDVRWGPAQPAPVTLELYPRVLRSPAEPLTIRLVRASTYPGLPDGRIEVAMLAADGTVHKQWRAVNLITLPFSRTVLVPPLAAGEGDCAVRVKITGYDGSTIWEWSEPVFVAGVSADRLADGRYVIDGSKRFVIGAYHALPEDYAALAAAGFNTVIAKSYDGEELSGLLDQVRAAGLKAMVTLGGAGQARGNVARLEDVVRAVRDHPAIIVWDLMDEPTRKGVGPREIAWYGRWAKSVGPGIPVALNSCAPYQFHRFASCVDVFSTDPYPLYSGVVDAERPALAMVSTWLREARRSLPPGRGLVATLEAFTFKASGFRAPNATELKNMVYQALASGVCGIMYYSVREPDWSLPDEALFAEIGRLNREVGRMAPWLVTDPLPGHELARTFSCDAPDALVSATWRTGGRYLTLLVNLGYEARDVRVKHSDAVTDAPVETVRLGPLEVRTLEY